MTKKKTAAAEPTVTAPAKPSALAALKAAISDKPSGSIVSTIGLGLSDPAIAGATRKGKSGAVLLGADPKILEDAAEAAKIVGEIKTHEALFKTKQSVLRDYGAEKRAAYNRAFRTDVTTVNVPYIVNVPSDSESATPGRETRHIQITCQNKYSVSQEPILKGDEILGEYKAKLFNIDEEKVLKPASEDLFRGILEELGITGEKLEKSMEALFETKKKVTTVENYESLEKEAPEAIRAFLSQSVTRQQPSLRFLNEEG